MLSINQATFKSHHTSNQSVAYRIKTKKYRIKTIVSFVLFCLFWSLLLKCEYFDKIDKQMRCISFQFVSQRGHITHQKIDRIFFRVLLIHFLIISVRQIFQIKIFHIFIIIRSDIRKSRNADWIIESFCYAILFDGIFNRYVSLCLNNVNLIRFFAHSDSSFVTFSVNFWNWLKCSHLGWCSIPTNEMLEK